MHLLRPAPLQHVQHGLWDLISLFVAFFFLRELVSFGFIAFTR